MFRIRRADRSRGATMVCTFWIIVLISLVGRVSAVQKCPDVFTDIHQKYLDEMIAGQLESSCTISKDLVVKGHLTDYCYNKIRLHQLWNLLNSLTFKNGSPGHKHTEAFKDLYKNVMYDCIKSGDDIEEDHIMACSQTTNLSPTDILETVKASFLIYQKFQPDSESDEKCADLYNECKIASDYTTKGSECACPSSTTLITQNLSEHKSATYSTSPPSHTISLVEDMSGTYPHKPTNPQKSTQDADTSSVISTNMQIELQALTTIMDQSHTATTMHAGANTESSHNAMDLTFISTEFPKGTTETLYMTLNPSQFSADPQQVRKVPSISNTEGLDAKRESPTTSGPSTNTYSVINEELSFVTKAVGEMLETLERDIVSQHSKVIIFDKSISKPSKEPGIESSFSSVTKIRRSLIDVDDTSREFVRTPTQSTVVSGTDVPFLTSLYASFPSTGNGLSNSEFPKSELQEKGTVDRNLGWASNYLSSSMLATKSSRTGLPMSSPGSGVTPILSEVSKQHPALTVHKGVYTHNILPQQEAELAAFISDNRENRFAGPNQGSNLLPVIETEKHGNGRTEEHRQSNFFVIFPIILILLGLLCLCGLLYYRYHYRLLQRRLHRDCDLQLPELRPLQVQTTETV